MNLRSVLPALLLSCAALPALAAGPGDPPGSGEPVATAVGAEALQHLCHHRLTLGVVSDVRFISCRVNPAFQTSGYHCGCLFVAGAVVDRHVIAVTGKSERRSGTYPSRRPGYQYSLFFHINSPSPFTFSH